MVEEVKPEVVQDKKKKKKKKKKNRQDDEEEKDPELKYLEEAVQKNMEVKERMKGFQTSINAARGYVVSSTPSIIKMDRKYFSFRREMKQLFQDSASEFGALGLDADEREERKQGNVDAQLEAQMEGASKKQKRRIAQM